MVRFAAIGLDHRHIYDLTQGLLDAGAECVGYNPDTTDRACARRLPEALSAGSGSGNRTAAGRSLDRLHGDRGGAARSRRPRHRSDAARQGRDGGQTGRDHLEQLAAVQRAVAETGRFWSVALGRLASPAKQEALRIVRSGELGRLVHTTALAPHRLNRALRPAWFFDAPAYGGIINDIGVHSIDQFLAFADAADAEIVHSTVGAFGTEPAGFEDFAELMLATPSVRGYVRLDWFTPDGLPTWGDGRLLLVGTEGTLELRKNLDIEGRPGTDHMFVANRSATRYVDCSALPVTYYRDFVAGVAGRNHTVMPQAQVFTVCRLALQAQSQATRYISRSA